MKPSVAMGGMAFLLSSAVLLVGLAYAEAQPVPTRGSDLDLLDIQLVNGSAPNEGRVLIRWSRDSPWIAVCYGPSPFNHAVPFQMCRRLGYPFACSQDYAGTHRTDDASLVNIRSEFYLVSCSAHRNNRSIGGCTLEQAGGLAPTCFHDQDMWLSCGFAGMPNFELRLVEGTYGYPNGLVQGRCGTDREWSAVCGHQSNRLRQGRVACRELGYSDQAVRIGYVQPDELDAQHKPNYTLFVDIGCFGNETSLTECLHYALRDCMGYLTLECFTGVTEYMRTAYLCGSKQLCGDQCQQNHPINGSNDDNFHYCQCDDACGWFDDCCYNHAGECRPSINPNRPSLERGGFTLDQFGCVWVPGSRFTHIGYVVVDSCPISWRDEGTRDLCERPVTIGDVIGSLPVYDHQDVDFKNIFCALCNGRSLNRLKRWDVFGYNSQSAKGVTFYPSLNQTLPSNGWLITPPRGHVVIRECPAHLVDTCLEPFRGTELEDGCKAYYAPIKVEVSSDTRYRNPHCAMCNGRTVAPDSSCIDQRCTEYCSPDPWGPCGGVCSPYDGFLTIEALFDFSSSSIRGTSCSEGQIYDPFLEKCRVLTCATGYENKGEECVVAPSVPPSRTNSSDIYVIECLSEGSEKNSSEIFPAIDHVHTKIDPHAPSALVVSVLVRSTSEANNLENAFDVAITTIQNKARLNSSLPCNISTLSIFLPFSFNGSSHCNDYTEEGSDVFPGYQGRLLTSARFRNVFGEQYLKDKVASSCLKVTDLNCSSLLTLEENEYSVVSEKTIRVVATGAILDTDEYVLFMDGTAVVCSYIVPTPEGVEPQIRRAISFIGSLLSLLALAATFVTYCLFPVIRNISGLCTMNLVVALFVAIFMFLLSGVLGQSEAACEFGAVVAHYAWLAAFCWMTVLAGIVARTLTSMLPRSSRNSGVNRALIAYALLAWGIPLLIVCICLILQYCDCAGLPVIYAEGGICWITDVTTRLVAFMVPLTLCLALIICLYVVTLVSMRRNRSSSKAVRKQSTVDEAKEELAVYAKLSALVGVTWVFGFISQSVTGIIVFSYIYIILNYLQGVFIFIAFCLNKRVRGLWREKMRKRQGEHERDAKHTTKESAIMMSSFPDEGGDSKVEISS